MGCIAFRIYVGRSNRISDRIAIKDIPDAAFDQFQFKQKNIKKVSIHTPSNLDLHALLISNDSNTWVVIVHGYKDSAKGMSKWADHFFGLEHNILMPDLRAHGRSAGKYIGFGWLEKEDLLQWVDFIVNLDDNAQIVLYGVSMGGAAVLMAAAQGVTQNVKGIITDSAPADILVVAKRALKWKYGILTPIIIAEINILAKLLAGYKLEDASVAKYAKNISLPTLLIHGGADGFVIPINQIMIFDCLENTKKALTIKDANHTQSVDVSPKEYWKEVDAFLQKLFYNIN